MIKLKPIDRQVVVVFGASSGIGRETALRFARRGAKVVAAARSRQGLSSLIDEIERSGGEASWMAADAADFKQVEAVALHAVEKFGRIDSWVHTAATAVMALFEQITPEEFKRVIEVNLLGQAYGAMVALPHLRNAGGGALIHVSSVEAWRTVPFQSAYGASKHGVSGFLEALRVELQHDRVPISVTEILPAAINTPFYDKTRTKLGVKPRPVPPIYHPRVVADAILYAAEHPVRALVAGGAGEAVVLSQRLSPLFADFVTRQVAFKWQHTDAPKSADAPNSLFEPIGGYDTVEGPFADEARSWSVYTWVETHPVVKRALALLMFGGAIAALRAVGKRRAFSGDARNP